MAILRRVEHAEERMDRPDIDRAQLEGALRHVAGVNRWLGARRALLRHLPSVLPPPGRPARVLDVGTGSGDLPVAITRWAEGDERDVRLTAVDLHPETLSIARERVGAHSSIRLARCDGLNLPFATGTFDVVLLSMTLHHMDGPSTAGLLREAGRVAAGGHVLVGELERSLPHYLGARLLAATVWRGNPITRHDGPLSVLRAFTPAELRRIAREAGLSRPRVHRHPVFRLVLVAEAGP